MKTLQVVQGVEFLEVSADLLTRHRCAWSSAFLARIADMAIPSDGNVLPRALRQPVDSCHGYENTYRNGLSNTRWPNLCLNPIRH